MSKRIILKAIFILSVLVGVFCIANGLRLIYEFKSNIVEFTIPSELEIEHENGRCDLFVLVSKSNKEKDADYLKLKDVLNQIVITTKEGSNIKIDKKDSDITYKLFDNVYKSVGSFEVGNKQLIRIESNAENISFEKLAYAKEGVFLPIFGIMKYSLLLLLCVGAALVSGISLLVLKRNKMLIANIAE